jgi:hypothetical protein
MAKQRISYVPLEKMDAEMRKEMERCQREGTPRPESTAVRAHVPAASGSSPTRGATCSATALPIMRSKSCAGSMSRARCSASTAAISVR